jgi:hypothetical protein
LIELAHPNDEVIMSECIVDDLWKLGKFVGPADIMAPMTEAKAEIISEMRPPQKGSENRGLWKLGKSVGPADIMAPMTEAKAEIISEMRPPQKGSENRGQRQKSASSRSRPRTISQKS